MQDQVPRPPMAVGSAMILSGGGTTIKEIYTLCFVASTCDNRQGDMKLWPPAVPPQLVTRPATKMSVAVMRQPEN